MYPLKEHKTVWKMIFNCELMRLDMTNSIGYLQKLLKPLMTWKSPLALPG